jgi:ADP-ribose pyrophosphatase YjhB (NUDIX family)
MKSTIATPAHHSLDHLARPLVTVDDVLISNNNGHYAVLLIRRRNEPFANCWALPGGFILEHEPPGCAANRKLTSETNLKDIPLMPIGVFGDRGRDPRGWMMTVAYCAIVDRTALDAFAGDDAADAKWFELDWNEQKDSLSLSLTHGGLVLRAVLEKKEVTTSLGGHLQFDLRENDGIAFDHGKIIATAIMRMTEFQDA